jgi:hypothetical protein
MKRCCGNKCNNEFDGPGLLCPQCKAKIAPNRKRIIGIHDGNPVIEELDPFLLVLMGSMKRK